MLELFHLYTTGGYGFKPNKPAYGAQPLYGMMDIFSMFFFIRLNKSIIFPFMTVFISLEQGSEWHHKRPTKEEEVSK